MNDNLTILIAEDDAGHYALVKKNLWRSCIHSEILHFCDGQEIVDYIFDEDGSVRIPCDRSYVLLLDIRMPKIDGIEVLRRIRSSEELAPMVVIMLTTTDDPAEVRRCYDMGCNFYIVKPSDYTEFMECVENLGQFLSLNGVNIATVSPAKQPDGAKH